MINFEDLRPEIAKRTTDEVLAAAITNANSLIPNSMLYKGVNECCVISF
jgi:hypothetical protein